MRTNCGLRTVVKILEIFYEVLGGKCGKIPCYNTVENWMKKLGLSVYENDRKPCPGKKYALVIDESIMINSEKLLLLLGIPADHQGRPIRHDDVTVVGMEVGRSFSGDDIKDRIETFTEGFDEKPEYVINDQGHNLLNGVAKAGIPQHIDISHAMGTCLKQIYGKEADFLELTKLLGEIRLQYHLTDKAYLLQPNMRSIARFMNMSSWVEWGEKMLGCFSNLPKNIQEAYSFIPKNKNLLDELAVGINAIRHVEEICKNKGFNLETYKECRHYIIHNVLCKSSNNRGLMLGCRMIEYFRKEASLLTGSVLQNDNLSSDIIESDFGIFKSKKSPNKLYGITSFALIIPLYPKLVNKSVTELFDFKERMVNVKLKDIDAWSKDHMSTNWVTERTKALKSVG